MEGLTALILAALLLTVMTLATGIGSMIHGGEFDWRHSHQLMFARVGFQGLALVLLIAALMLSS